MKKSARVSDMDMSTMVGMEEAWPVLFRVMGVLGFVVAKRRPSGHYETCWLRLIPMVAIMTSGALHLFAFPHSFKDNYYDSFIHVFVSTTNIGLTFNAFAVAVLRRRATCSLFQALDGTLRPSKPWVSIVSSLLFVSYVACYSFKYYLILDLHTGSIAKLVSTTLLFPTVSFLLDLYLMALIDAVHKAHKGKVERLDRRFRRPSRRPRPPPSGTLFQVNTPVEQGRDLMSVSSVIELFEDLFGLVSLYNEVFSPWIFQRCVDFLLKLSACSYFLTVTAKEHVAYAIFLFYFVEEIGRFGLLCRRADLLGKASKALEDTTFALLQQPDTPTEDRIQLLSLLAQLRNRPALIAVGNVGVLGSNLLVSLINVAMTYAAILFQYQPSTEL